MIEALPWPAQVGVVSAGYLAFVSVCLLVVRGYVNGNTFPRRTVEQLERRNEIQEQTISELVATNKALTQSTALSNAVMENLQRAVDEVTDQ